MTTTENNTPIELIVPKTVQKWMAKIRKTNAEFEASCPSQKRVLLAKDVLAALRARRFDVETGRYTNTFGAHEDEKLKDANVKAASAAQTLYYERHEQEDAEGLPSEGPKVVVPLVMSLFAEECQVCAKGALFVAKLDRLGGVDLGEYTAKAYGGDPSDYLLEYFSQYQLDLIECAFEQDAGYMCVATDDAGEEEAEVASDFAEGISDPSERLRLIMENIVAHNGTFVP